MDKTDATQMVLSHSLEMMKDAIGSVKAGQEVLTMKIDQVTHGIATDLRPRVTDLERKLADIAADVAQISKLTQRVQLVFYTIMCVYFGIKGINSLGVGSHVASILGWR
jgi:hypothetical protein